MTGSCPRRNGSGSSTPQAVRPPCQSFNFSSRTQTCEEKLFDAVKEMIAKLPSPEDGNFKIEKKIRKKYIYISMY